LIAAADGVAADPALRARLADLYCAYDDALNDGALERWPALFTEACIYKARARTLNETILLR
jgi:3-phenylpropionate/cinnamic acid dioxygenase small subunit